VSAPFEESICLAPRDPSTGSFPSQEKPMFQSFQVTSTPQFGKERVAALRAALADLNVDGFLVPRADEFQGEYVPASSERLLWLSGFTGSAGIALITQQQVVIFVDGRYVTQLKEQVDSTVFTGGDLVGEPPHLWLEHNGKKRFPPRHRSLAAHRRRGSQA
jgi:Xaa-Pro aminopeptidase